MQCLKCGTTNPEGAKYCFECGTALPEPLKEDYSNFTFCPKCNTSNPKKGRFCYECGNPLEDTKPPQPLLCPTCGISIDTSRQFCPNCGQSLIEKPWDLKKEQPPVSPKETQTECPACGQLTTGDYCRSCGYNLTTQLQKRPIDWWYCDRDSAIMTEIDPNLQIPVSRNSLNESLAQAISDNILQYQDREKARFLALQLFESNTNTNFEVLSQVRCPVCSQQSLAPTTKRPHQQRIHYAHEIALNVSTMLHSGIFYLRTYPKFLLIALCGVIIDTVLLFLGFSALSTFSTNSLFSLFGVPLTGNLPIEVFSFSLTTFILTLIASYLVNVFIHCWYYTSLKEIASNVPFNLLNSFKKSFRYFPRALAAQLLIFGGIIGITIGSVLLLIILAGILFSGYNYQILLFLAFAIIIGVLGFGAFIMLLNVLLSYVNMSIVFDERSGIILSLRRSWRFTRQYFWTTVGIIIIFSVGSSIVGYIQTFSYMFFYFAFLPSLISMLIYTVLTRLIEGYRALSMGWGYQTFHHLID